MDSYAKEMIYQHPTGVPDHFSETTCTETKNKDDKRGCWFVLVFLAVFAICMIIHAVVIYIDGYPHFFAPMSEICATAIAGVFGLTASLITAHLKA
jgi:hypothetical protein